MSTVDFISLTGAIVPDRTALVVDSERISFSHVAERSNKVANALQGLGVGHGDKVAMMDVNCSQFVETYFGVARLGAIFVPLNYRARQDELSYLLQHAEASVVIVGERYVDLVNLARAEAPGVKHIIALGKAQSGMLSYEDIVSAASDDEVFPDVGPEDVTLLLYTAGTTGRPKGVPLTHGSFESYMAENVSPPDMEIEETNLLAVPLYHVAGFQAVLAAIYGGRTLAMMGQFDEEGWLATVERERVNRAMLVPTMLKRVIDHPSFDKHDLSSLRLVTYGAASMPLEVIKKAIKVLPGVKFINAFGQTETSSTVLALGPEDHDLSGTPEEVEKKLQRLSSSIGKPLPGAEVAVLDEEGNPLGPNEVGVIAVRGQRVMSGYWKDSEKTSQSMTASGWLKTGDMGWQDEDGYFFLAGRGDDMIIRAGENISPEEVEQVLQSHPKVEEAAVIGVTDPDWGQQPKAVVVLKAGQQATPEELMEHCRSNLASFKRPRDVVFVSSLPRNPMGKVIRKALREMYGQAES
ncbi:MAG: long-chain-fatty-acid--CoA ligase [Dehalococcoidia bacterium]|nr:long-chain-fatty-acid--CoA ligase [Dehalococcoidia bacterium]